MQGEELQTQSFHYGEGGNLFIGNLPNMRGSLWNYPPYMWELYEENKCIRTKDMLENGFMSLY